MRLLALLTLSVFASASSADQIIADSNGMPVCYDGYSYDALNELLNFDFDPALDESEAHVTNGNLVAPQFDEKGSHQQTITVPPCEGNTDFDKAPVQETETPVDDLPKNMVSFACFETMANIYENTKPLTKDYDAKITDVIERAKKDAKKRAKKMNQKYEPVVYANIYADKYLHGLKIVFTSGEDDEYADYFLYTVAGDDLQLMSSHFGDDQGPELEVYCQGWSEGVTIP